MSSLESVVCPWIGCGGTIRKTLADPEHNHGWVCDMCGEFFASPQDYQDKLRKENEWAEAWVRWSEEKTQGDVEAKPKEIEEVSVEEEIEEVSVEEEIEEVSVAH